jgi:hypothetical protein
MLNFKIRKIPEFFFLKSGKSPKRFFRVSFDCLKCIFPHQIINNVILYLYKLYMNETVEHKTRQDINNSINKKLSTACFAINLHVVS